MTERVATTPGVFPLPDWAKEDLADLKGHQKGDLVTGDEGPEIESVYETAREEVVGHQQVAGIDRIVEGQLRWDDFIAHPLCVHSNVNTGGIVRYYDNNNFYRDPRVRGDLDFSGDVAAELEAAASLLDEGADDALQAVLPGPWSLADLATDQHYGDEADFLAAVADFLAGEVEAFPAHETLFLLEPSLVTNGPQGDLAERASAAIDRVAGATDADVVVHSPWGSHDERVYAHLLDADVSAIGFDLIAADPEAAVENVTEFGTKGDIGLGLVDGQNTAVESPATVDERVDWVLDRVPTQTFETVYVTTNTEPVYLPVSTYREKLATVAAACGGTPEDDPRAGDREVTA